MTDDQICALCDRPVQGQRTVCKICTAGTPPGSDNDPSPPGIDPGEQSSESEDPIIV